MKKSICILITAAAATLMALQPAAAQKIQSVSGEYRYVVPDNVTMAEARRTAEKRARTEAIAQTFGTIISQSTSTVIKNDTGQSTVDFLSLNESDVKGEWLSNTRDPEYQYLVDERTGQQVVICRVWGKAREIVAAKVDFTAKILRKEADPAFESETFKNGDQFYLYFTSPTDGYLAVYMVDAEQTAYCLLPYMNDTDGQTRIVGGREYIFFSIEKADRDERAIVDEYVMTTPRSVEHDNIYIISPPNASTTANDLYATDGLPRQLNFADFHKWLTRCRTRDAQMATMQKVVTIKK